MTFDPLSVLVGVIVGAIVGIVVVVFAAYRIWFRTDA